MARSNPARTKRALPKKLASLILAGILLVTYAFPTAALADSSYLALESGTTAGTTALNDNSDAGANSLKTQSSNPGKDLLTDQKFYTAAVKSIATLNPLELSSYIIGFGLSEVFGLAFGDDPNEPDPTQEKLDEIKENVEKIMKKLDEVSQKQDQMISQLSTLNTLVECTELNNVLNSFQQLENKNLAPASIYNALKQEEEDESLSDEERDQRIMSDLLGGMGFGSDYMTYNRTDVAFDNYVYDLGQAIMGPYKVTFGESGPSNQSGNLFWIYYEYQRRNVVWEHQADESRAAFNNNVVCMYLLAATIDLQSMGARLRAIQEYNANRSATDLYVSETPVRQMMTKLQDQMNDVASTASEWVVYPNTETRYYWVPGHEMRFYSTIESTSAYSQYESNSDTVKVGWYGGFGSSPNQEYLEKVFPKFRRNQDSGKLLADTEELNQLLNIYKSEKDAGRIDDEASFWQYLNDEGFVYTNGLVPESGSISALPTDFHSPWYNWDTNHDPKYYSLKFSGFSDTGNCSFSVGASKNVDDTLYSFLEESDELNFSQLGEPTTYLIHLPAETKHSLTRHEGHAATCSKQGLETYYTCSTCGKWFSDATGNNEILKDEAEKDESKLALPMTEHQWYFKNFTWKPSEDGKGYESATANFACARDKSHTMAVRATITRTVSEGTDVFTATVPVADSPDKLTHTAQATTKHVHTPQVMAAEKAACMKTGLTEGSKCSTCGKVLTEQVTIPAYGHDWTFKGFTWQPSDDGTGYESATANYTCKRDASHTTTAEATITVTESGESRTYTATVSKKDSSDNLKHADTKAIACPQTPQADACAHTPQTITAKKATCTDTGLTEGSRCSTCGEVLTEQKEVPALGHAWRFAGFFWNGNSTDGYSMALAVYTCGRAQCNEYTLKRAKIKTKAVKATTKTKGKTIYTAVISASNSPDGKKHATSKAAKIVAKLKKANPAIISGKTVSVRLSDVKKKSITKKVVSVSGAKGKVTYKIASGKAEARKALSLNKKTGTVTVKKGAGKGTYALNVIVKAGGNASYKSKSKTVKMIVKVE